jgi:hypothetical protein
MKMHVQHAGEVDGHQGRAAEASISAAAMLDQEEAARFLRVQPRTLESWRQRRIGPRFVRYSVRCVRYRAQDLQVWLDSPLIDTENSDRLRHQHYPRPVSPAVCTHSIA